MKKTINIKDENDKDIEYEILLDFILRKNNKRYLVYTDNTTSRDGSLNVYASIYINDTLEDILTDEEWNEIEKRLNKIIDNEINN